MSLFIATVFYAFCGWLIEVSFYLHKTKTFVNRGFLHGPFVPIYGLSMISLAFVFDPLLNTIHLGGILLIFITIVFVSTLFELIGGWALWALFETRWWDYSKEKFHYKGFISLKYSLLWGIMGTVSYLLVHRWLFFPWLERQDANALQAVGVFFILILSVDYILTIFSLINFRALIVELRGLSNRFRKQLPELEDVVPETLLQPLMKVKESERFSSLKARYESLKSRYTQFKHARLQQDFTQLQSLSQKISKTRLYRAFPELRIRMLEQLKKRQAKDDHDES